MSEVMEQNQQQVNHFISQIEDPVRKKDIYRLLHIFERASGYQPKMWGPSMIGFGQYHYRLKEKFEGDAPLVAFALKKTKINLYLAYVMEDNKGQLKRLGKCRMGQTCIFIKSVDDINEEVLGELIFESIQYLKAIYE